MRSRPARDRHSTRSLGRMPPSRWTAAIPACQAPGVFGFCQTRRQRQNRSRRTPHARQHCRGLVGDLSGGQRRIHDDRHGRAGVLREPVLVSHQPSRQEHHAEQAESDCRDDLDKRFPAQVRSRQGDGSKDPSGPQRRREYRQRILQRHVVQRGDREDRVAVLVRQGVDQHVTQRSARCRECGASPPRSSPRSDRRRRPVQTVGRVGPRTLRRHSRHPAPAGSAAASGGAAPAGNRRCDPNRPRSDRTGRRADGRRFTAGPGASWMVRRRRCRPRFRCR